MGSLFLFFFLRMKGFEELAFLSLRRIFARVWVFFKSFCDMFLYCVSEKCMFVSAKISSREGPVFVCTAED